MNNDFRTIPSLENLYEVNSDGSVIRNVKTKRPLKVFKKNHNSNTEYFCTQVNLRNKIRKVFIHRVVAECWIGPRPDGMQCDHVDRNSLNNDYRNLRYVTKSEQMLNRNYDTFMDSCRANLAACNGGSLNPVLLVGEDGTEIRFPSARKASKWLAKEYPDKTEKHFNDKFHLRRSAIFNYRVVYLPDPTGLPHPEEEVNLHIKEAK